MEIRYMLKEMMEKKKLSYRKLELLSGVSKSELQKIAQNEVHPLLITMVRIADALKVDIEDLYVKTK